MISKELLERSCKWSLEDYEFNCIIVSDETLFIRLNNLINGKYNIAISYFVPAMIAIVKKELRIRGYKIN